MNAGVGGSTAAQILSDQVPLIAAFKPTIITIQAGTNDIVKGASIDEYRQNLDAILDAASASGARVIVLPQYEWFRSPWFTSREGRLPDTDMATQRAAFDDELIAEGQARGAQFIDLRPQFTREADGNEWFVDGIHPTQLAYDEWAAGLAYAVPAPCQ